jgi:hypothetical protein
MPLGAQRRHPPVVLAADGHFIGTGAVEPPESELATLLAR